MIRVIYVTKRLKCLLPTPTPSGQTALLTVFLGVAMKVTGGNPQGLHNQVSPALVNQINHLTTTVECTD